MKRVLCRLTLGISAALLIGGWGATRYADEQQQAFANTGPMPHKAVMWVEGQDEWIGPSRTIFRAGVICMAIGAGLIGLGIPRPMCRRALEQSIQ